MASSLLFHGMIITWKEAEAIQNAQGKKTALSLSFDLGKTRTEIKVENNVIIIGKKKLPIPSLRRVCKDKTSCYILTKKGVQKLALFDGYSYYKLVPTSTAPTLEISGIRMHNIKNTDPLQDANTKVSYVGVGKRALDTCMDLGYTALSLAQKGFQVDAVEISPAVLEMAKQNPWSLDVFENKKIKVIERDVTQFILGCKPNSYDAILHDPPRFALAPSLYERPFYQELLRVLSPGGKMFHYTGNPGSKFRGKDLVSAVCARLTTVGFVRVKPAYNGVVAEK